MSDKNQPGYFIFSLDTELATGHFDREGVRQKIFSENGVRERKAISSILDLMDEYKITGTWAVVGHLFYDHCEECEVCPMLEWKGKYSSFEEVYKTRNPLWYGSDVLDMITSRTIMKHEIAFHGYTHEVFNEKSMTPDRARLEIREWKRVASRRGLEAVSIVFPRDDVGHLKILTEEKFISYRSEEFQPLIIRNRYFGRYVKALDHLLSVTTPPVYAPDSFKTNSMVNLKASQHLFGFNRKFELFLDSHNYHLLRIKRIVKGIEKAANTGKVIHIWAHPWEFRTEKDIEKLKFIFQKVFDEMQKGKMISISMANMAGLVMG